MSRIPVSTNNKLKQEKRVRRISDVNIGKKQTSVLPQTGGGLLSALRVNELRDGGAYTLPLASSILNNQQIIITLPDEFSSFTPTVTRTGSDTISYSGGTDTSITFDTGSSIRIELTSDGVSNWSL